MSLILVLQLYTVSGKLFVLVFAQFGQHAAGRLRVQERDAKPFGASARSLVDQLDAVRLAFGQTVFDPVDGKSHMVHAFWSATSSML